MTRRAFYVEGFEGSEAEPVLEGPLAHQLGHVLRLAPGAAVELRNGCGQAWAAEVLRCGKKSVTLRLGQPLAAILELPLDLTLALAYSRSDRMDLVLRQGVELGIRRFIAFPSERSQYGLTGEREQRKLERWRKIAQQALCQCGRAMLPEIRCCDGLNRFLTALEGDWPPNALNILALESGDRRSLKDLLGNQPLPAAIIALVGCEGGWTGAEADQLRTGGFRAVTLGPRILRLETAVTALLSAVQLLWGDLGGSTAANPANCALHPHDRSGTGS